MELTSAFEGYLQNYCEIANSKKGLFPFVSLYLILDLTKFLLKYFEHKFYNQKLRTMYTRKRLAFVDLNSTVISSVTSMTLTDVVVDLINTSSFGNNIKR